MALQLAPYSLPPSEDLLRARMAAAAGADVWLCVQGRPEPSTREAFPQFAWHEPGGHRWAGFGTALSLLANDGNEAWALPDACRAWMKRLCVAPEARPFLRCFGGLAFAPEEPGSPLGSPERSAAFCFPTWLLHHPAEGEPVGLLTLKLQAEEDEEALLQRISEAWESWSTLGLPALAVPCEGRLASQVAARDNWKRAIESALSAIKAGEMEKVVLARALRVEGELSPWAAFEAIAQAGGTHRFFFSRPDGSAFLGASPERLFELNGERAQTDALAGTAPRGDDAPQDARWASHLQTSDKDRREHALVVEGIAMALAPLSLSLDIPQSPVLRKLPTLQHLHTPIVARLREGVTLEALLRSLHPTPAVGGSPRAAALDLIRSEEGLERGWYAGPVGWVSPEAACFAVGIRSAYVAPDQAWIMAGAGIVSGSSVEGEWDETARKATPMIEALTGGLA